MAKKRPLIARIFDPKMWLHDFIVLTGGIPVLLDLRIKKKYITKKKPRKLFRGRYIISSNHISYKDALIICSAFWMRRVGFVATSEMFESKIPNFLFTKFGCISIDKNNPSLKTFKGVQDMLDRGHIIGVFPEGQIHRDGNIDTFKSGIVMMAVMADVDLLPVYIMKRKHWYNRQVVAVGEKLNYKDYMNGAIPTIDEINNISNVLRKKEIELEELCMKLNKKRGSQ